MYLFDLSGKVAVVTGGTRGIGMMMARGLLQAGASVYISSRKPEAGDAAAGELSQYGTVLSVPADLSREEECQRLAAEVGRFEEGIHVLVNNAGANWGAPLEEFPAHGWDKVVDLNLKTPFYLTRAFLPLLEADGTADDPARVINVGSIDGLRVPYEYPTYSYSASKAGLHQLTRVLARELGPRHITVNAVAPGPFESKMMAATLAARGDEIAASSPLGRIGRADDMAGVAVFLSGRGSAYITGAVIPVDGGIWPPAGSARLARAPVERPGRGGDRDVPAGPPEPFLVQVRRLGRAPLRAREDVPSASRQADGSMTTGRARAHQGCRYASSAKKSLGRLRPGRRPPATRRRRSAPAARATARSRRTPRRIGGREPSRTDRPERTGPGRCRPGPRAAAASISGDASTAVTSVAWRSS